jgi:hypothetical protein
LIPFKKILRRAFPGGLPQENVVQTDILERPKLRIRTTPVMWGIPLDEVMFSQFFIFFEKHANRMPWDGLAMPKGTYLGKARNTVHKAYVTHSNLPYLMMLDSDIAFPPNMLEALMAHNLPIVGGWYRDKNKENNPPTVYDFIEEKEDVVYFRNRTEPGKGLEKVDGMGAGCWLMSRETAVALGEEPYETFGGGEDFKLSRKLMKLGIPLHVEWSINCAHFGVGHV